MQQRAQQTNDLENGKDTGRGAISSRVKGHRQNISSASPPLFIWIIVAVSCLGMFSLFIKGTLIGSNDNTTTSVNTATNTQQHLMQTDNNQQQEQRQFTLKSSNAFEAVEERIMNAQEIHAHLKAASLPLTTPIVYFVTPTVSNEAQWVNMVRLSQTLMHDKAIYWIVVEDAPSCSKRLRAWLEYTGMMFAHVRASTPPEIQKMEIGPKGVVQRNRALEIVEEMADGPPGVVYFGDDDNAYDLRLFPELRKTTSVSVFGVGFRGGGMYERCIVHKDTGKVWYIATNWAGERKFPMDMGGWAFHTSKIRKVRPRFRNDWPMGFLETKFVEQVADKMSDLEPICDKCTKIYVWHVKTGGSSGTKVYSDPNFDQIKGFV